MPDYVSPYVAAAAARAALEGANKAYRASLEMPLRIPAINPCPSCGKHPAIDPAFFRLVCIYCDNDDCTGRDMQACGDTLKDAAAKWNGQELD